MCPEDHHCPSGSCKADKELCEKCRLPICRDCQIQLWANKIPAIALMNDNWQGYLDAWVYMVGLTWMEKTVASPFWTGQTLFEIQTQRRELGGSSKRKRHKMHDELHAGKGRIAFKGQCFSATMDFEELAKQLKVLEKDEEGQKVELPVTGELLAARVRIYVTAGLIDLNKHMKQATVRRDIVVQYMRMQRDAKHPDYAKYDMKGIEEKAKRWLPTNEPTVPPEVLPRDYLQGASGSEEDEFTGTDKAATPAERCRTEQDLERAMDRARPQLLLVQRDSDAKKDVEASRVNALEQFAKLDLRIASTLENQIQTLYIPRVFHNAMPWCVGGPDFAKRVRPRRGGDPDSTELHIDTFLRMTAGRIEAQFQTDWDFHPAVSGLAFASKVNMSPSMALQKAVGAGGDWDTMTDEKLSAAAEALYKKLHHGHYREGDKRVAIAGRVDKLALCDSLTPVERSFVKNFLFMSSKIPGTRQIRRQMRYLVFSAAVVYGLPVWITITPSERHSGLAIHLFRGRVNDPAFSRSAHGGAFAPYLGYDAPSLRPPKDGAEQGIETVVIDLPDYDLRRLITSRHPQCCVQAFKVACRVIFPALYGFRM